MTNLGPAGQTLYDHLTDLDPEDHELPTVLLACNLADRIAGLQSWVTTHGSVAPDGSVYAAAKELRACELNFIRLMAALKIPDANETQSLGRRGPKGKTVTAIRTAS